MQGRRGWRGFLRAEEWRRDGEKRREGGQGRGEVRGLKGTEFGVGRWGGRKISEAWGGASEDVETDHAEDEEDGEGGEDLFFELGDGQGHGRSN